MSVGAPRACIVPPTLDFGDVAVGTSAELSFDIESCGVGALTVRGVALAPSSAPAFSLGSVPSIPFSIPAAGTTQISGTGAFFPSRGIYRSTNAAGATPTFAKLTGLAGNTNSSVRDIAIDPADPNILVASLVASGGAGGIYRTANALAGDPNTVSFTQTQVFNSTSTSELATEFAAIHPAGDTDATPMSIDVRAMVASGSMEHTECVLCGTCVDTCPNGVVRYSFSAGRSARGARRSGVSAGPLG